MASTIIGTFPIFNGQNSSIDEFGIQTLVYNFTIKIEDAATYIPNKDDEYYGPDIPGISGIYDPRTSANHSVYRVVNVATNNMPGELMQVSVSTMGTLNIYTAPKIRMVPNCPLVYGIQGVVVGSLPHNPETGTLGFSPSSVRTLGYGISVTFLTSNDPLSEAFVFQNYFNRVMPTEIYNVLLPPPAVAPQTLSSTYCDTKYKGFICNDNSYERIGGVTKFTLIYKETIEVYVNTYEKDGNGNPIKWQSTSLLYSFP